MAIGSGFPKHHSRGHGKKILAAVIVIIVIAAIVVLASAGAITTISSTTSLNVPVGGTANFKVAGSPSTFSIYVRSSNAAGTGVYLSSTPILANPILSFSAPAGTALNISTFGTSHANINLKIISTTNSSVSFQLTPIPTDLSIGPSSSVSIINPSPLPGSTSNATYTAPPVVTPPKNTTTTPPANKTTTPPKNTTTTPPAGQVPALVYTVINASSYGTLMINLQTLYTASAGCTQGLYNQAVATYLGQAPTGPFDFYNASQNVPTSVVRTVHPLSTANEYIVNYTFTTPSSFTSGLALTFDISSTGTITVPKFTGLFAGDNYTTVSAGYQAQSAIHTPCAAYLS